MGLIYLLRMIRLGRGCPGVASQTWGHPFGLKSTLIIAPASGLAVNGGFLVAIPASDFGTVGVGGPYSYTQRNTFPGTVANGINSSPSTNNNMFLFSYRYLLFI